MLRGYLITTWARREGEGSVESPRGSRVDTYVKRPCLSTRGRGGGQNWVKFGSRIVECPLNFKIAGKGFQSYRFSSILMIKWAFAPIASRNSGDEVSKLSGENAN